MRHRAYWICALLAVAISAVPAQPATVFTNLVQPGNLYGPDSVGVGAVPVPGAFLSSATNFLPAFTARLTSLDLPVYVISGPAEIEVSLFADAGNLPGSLIEDYLLTNAPGTGPISLTTFLSVQHPILNAGTQYWVAVTGGTPSTFASWDLTLFTGTSAAGGASRTISNGVDMGWIRGAGTRVGALEVIGDPIPEPGPLLLTGLGVLILAAGRMKRAWRAGE